MIWCKYRFWEISSWSVRDINNLKWKSQKQFKKKSLTTFFLYREEGQLKGRTIISGLALFKLLAVLAIPKLYTYNTIFLDICNFLVTGILICKMLFFVKWKTHRFVFYLSCQTIPVIKNLDGKLQKSLLLQSFFLY